MTYGAIEPRLMPETRPGGDLRVDSKASSLFLLPSRSTGIGHITNAPQFKLNSVPTAIAAKLQCSQPVKEFDSNFSAHGFVHSLRRQPECVELHSQTTQRCDHATTGKRREPSRCKPAHRHKTNCLRVLVFESLSRGTRDSVFGVHRSALAEPRSQT